MKPLRHEELDVMRFLQPHHPAHRRPAIVGILALVVATSGPAVGQQPTPQAPPIEAPPDAVSGTNYALARDADPIKISYTIDRKRKTGRFVMKSAGASPGKIAIVYDDGSGTNPTLPVALVVEFTYNKQKVKFNTVATKPVAGKSSYEFSLDPIAEKVVGMIGNRLPP